MALLLNRRKALFGSTLLVGGLAANKALAASVDARELGLVADAGNDQTESLRAALAKTASEGSVLELPPGTFRVSNLALPDGARLFGVPGRTRLVSGSDAPVFLTRHAANLTLENLTFDGEGNGPVVATSGLAAFENCANLLVEGCQFSNGAGNGIRLHAVSGRVRGNQFSGFGETALFASDSTGLVLGENHISDCANGGIRVFRYEKGYDGTIVTANHITDIRSGSGNGQNGNGINVFLANNVMVANNVIDDCDFSAVRLNSTDDCQVLGNNCRRCREVAIFSEFAFSGSIVANNLIDDAATGISITNLDDGGRLAVCANNIVRNITPNSPTNPDTNPVGIFAEAECAVTGNSVDNVPGIGIQAGWGPYLRNVLVSNNVVAGTVYGIGVSVAEGAGLVRVSGNVITGASERAIAGFAWTELKGKDLAKNPNPFKNVVVGDNSVS